MLPDPKSISLNDAQKTAIAELAEESGKPWPVVLAEALSNFRAATTTNGNFDESFSSAAERLELIGCVEGPPDLSTNSAYMESFGKSGR